MSKCDNCRLRKESAKAFDIHWHGEDDCPYDKCPLPNFPKTNADHIRAMTDEELAEWIYQVQDEDALRKKNFLPPLSKSWWLDWLKQESEK